MSLGVRFSPHALERGAAADMDVLAARIRVGLIDRRLRLLEHLALVHHLARLGDPPPELAGAWVGLGLG